MTPVPAPAQTKPKKKKVLKNAHVYLDNLPKGEMYEKSFMHRDVVHLAVCSNSTGFLITGSEDGHVKFWKKQYEGMEFVKHYRAHLSKLLAMVLSQDGRQLATIGEDSALKLFEVTSFDMTCMIKLKFKPLQVEFVHKKNSPSSLLAVQQPQELHAGEAKSRGATSSAHFCRVFGCPFSWRAMAARAGLSGASRYATLQRAFSDQLREWHWQRKRGTFFQVWQPPGVIFSCLRKEHHAHGSVPSWQDWGFSDQLPCRLVLNALGGRWITMKTKQQGQERWIVADGDDSHLFRAFLNAMDLYGLDADPEHCFPNLRRGALGGLQSFCTLTPAPPWPSSRCAPCAACTSTCPGRSAPRSRSGQPW
ncbi:unnamed protein product [Effrenium voratum]|nr:unnamed protein product [Effrenium voratum]